MLSDEEKKEFLEAARSSKLREDFRKLLENRIDPFTINGEVNMDRVLEFLTECNAFIGHTPKLFRKIIDKDMRL